RALEEPDLALGSRVLGDLLATDTMVTGRWIEAFAEVAAASAAHRHALRTLTSGWLESGRASHFGRDLGKLLELLFESCVGDGAALASPKARAFLGSLTKTGKAARFAKRLLALQP